MTDTVQVTNAEMNANTSHVVKILMAVADMDQRSLAQAMKTDPAVITRLLKCDRSWTIEHLVKLSEVFDRPVGFFFENADSLIRTGSSQRPPNPPDNGPDVAFGVTRKEHGGISRTLHLVAA